MQGLRQMPKRFHTIPTPKSVRKAIIYTIFVYTCAGIHLHIYIYGDNLYIYRERERACGALYLSGVFLVVELSKIIFLI